MDARMASNTQPTASYTTWDFYFENGIVPYVVDSDADLQAAEIATFLQKGLVSELPYAGVDWLGYFMGYLSFGDLDTSIQANLINAGITDYGPQYSVSGDKLIVTVVKRQS